MSAKTADPSISLSGRWRLENPNGLGCSIETQDLYKKRDKIVLRRLLLVKTTSWQHRFLDLTNLVPMWLCNYVIMCIHEKETKNFLKFQTYSNMASTFEVVFLDRLTGIRPALLAQTLLLCLRNKVISLETIK